MPATPYPGVARPPVGQDAPSPAPNPNGAPTVNIPADIDPNNVATFVLQQCRTLADWHAFHYATVHPCAPALPSNIATAFGGFSAVSHVGAALGTVTPTDNSLGAFQRSNSGNNYVVKIIGGGVVGVATFQLSTDGGATYDATQATAATVVDQQVVLAFNNNGGSFTAGDTYAFSAALTPQAWWGDAAAQPKYLISHNGYPMGRINIFQEEWVAPTGNLAIAAPIAVLPRWTATHEGADAGLITSVDPSGTYLARTILVDKNGDASATAINLNTCAPIFNFAGANAASFHSLEAEWEMFSTKGNSGALDESQSRYFVGLVDAIPTATLGTGVNAIGFTRIQTDAHWFGLVSNGTGQTRTDTGVNVTGGAVITCKLEVHGKNSAFGAVTVLFFMNGVLVASSTTNYPTVSTAAYFLIQNRNMLGGAAKCAINMGPLRVVWNRTNVQSTVTGGIPLL